MDWWPNRSKRPRGLDELGAVLEPAPQWQLVVPESVKLAPATGTNLQS